MKPKFEVGEVVILQCKNYPELNGDYIIADRRVGRFRNILTGLPVERVGYDLGPLLPDIKWFDEIHLRKKHQPGTLKFDQLMDWMKQPQKLLTHQPH